MKPSNIPKQLYVSEGALEIRMPLTPDDVETGRLTKYSVVQNLGIDSRTLASFSVRETENGYEIQRRFNLLKQKPVKIGHTLLLKDAENAAYSHACKLANFLPAKPTIPTYDFVKKDTQALEEKLKEREM